jgi:hypothetical protein
MATMTMSGFGLKHLPTRSVREAARTAVDPQAELVSTGNVRAWDLFALCASAIPGAPEWADRTLDGIVAAAMDRFKDSLTCTDCEDVGFYGLVDRENPDILTSLLRRVDDGGYEQLTASAGWKPYEIVADQQLEILTRDLACDLADAVTAGASGLARRYFWPAAFLPPDSIIAAGPAKELTDPNAATDTQDALDTETAAEAGWVSYAVVDDLDPGAVIDVIRLRRGPAGPELLAYRNGAWAEAPDLLSDLQGVQPPPLVELSADQMASVLAQVDAGGAGADQQDGESASPQDDQEGAQAVAAALGLTAAGPDTATRDKLAKEGKALPEGGFPIANTEDLKKAVRALGRATNPAAAKRHIIKRARELDAVGVLPESWGLTAAFQPNRVPAGSSGGGQFAPLDASERAASEKKRKQDEAEAQRQAARDEKERERLADRAQRQSEHEQDRSRRQSEHDADRAKRQSEHDQDRARRLAQQEADRQAKAAKKKATTTAKKGSAAKKANYGNGGVAGYNPHTGVISYKDGSSYDGRTWKTADGKRITASGALIAAVPALVADAPLTVSPDPRAEKLRRYWSEGKGALKIRWGTPGDWTRCYRQLRKYMGLRAKGYCQNLHKRSTGVWTGSRLNPGGHRGRGHALAASGTSGALSMEAALLAAVSTGRWFCPEGGAMTLKDGIYVEGGSNSAILKTLTAGGFPVNPADEWFENPQLDAPTPLTVDDDGRIYGHIATRDVAHIGLPGRVKAPKSRSNYAYFKTGQLVTASGKKVNVGQITLAGGHAPLQADAAAAVAHYDNTASAVADVNCGDDKWGIWVAGALRPEVTPTQLRTLRASAPSGDWRPINGGLELVACCQVNVPGFPVVRARVASGAITSLVAAGAGPLYARRLAMMADAAVAERVAALESVVFAQLSDGLENPDDVIVADGETDAAEGGEPLSEEEAQAEGLAEDGEQPVSDAVRRAREAVAARRAAQSDQGQPETPAGTPEAPSEDPDPEKAKAARLADLRERVHGKKEPVAASA